MRGPHTHNQTNTHHIHTQTTGCVDKYLFTGRRERRHSGPPSLPHYTLACNVDTVHRHNSTGHITCVRGREAYLFCEVGVDHLPRLLAVDRVVVVLIVLLLAALCVRVHARDCARGVGGVITLFPVHTYAYSAPFHTHTHTHSQTHCHPHYTRTYDRCPS